MSAPFKLTVSPADAMTTAVRSREVLTVTNSGTKALVIHTAAQDLTRANGRCAIAPSTVAAKFTPSQFTLAPGTSRSVRVVVSVPSGSHGRTDIYLVASGHSAVTGSVSVSGAVGSLLEVERPGHTAKALCVALSAPQHHASGIPVAEAAGGLSALVLCLAASVALVRHRMRSIPHRAKHATRRADLWSA